MPSPADSRKRILVVDDVPDTRQLLAAFVRRRGYEPVECADGAEALRALREQPSALCAVILDLQMQGMDGFEFRQQQLADPVVASVPVIVITRTGRHETLKYVLNVTYVIFKPLVVEQLELALRDHCGVGPSLPTFV